MRLIQSILVVISLQICLSASQLSAQKIIRGVVRDAETQIVLPAANIQIEGTYRGTISNEDGRYALKISDLPSTIRVSYIGYHSKTFQVRIDSPDELDIKLSPAVFEFDPVVVTAEDPGVSIMREVIRRKKIWQAKLYSYKAEAYSRMRFENDSGIVSIAESISSAFWDKNQGPREVIKSKRQTSNISEQENFAAASYVANFYDDDIEIQGFNVIGPTHPDALNHYHFKLEGQRTFEGKAVFDISMTPKGRLQPTFKGMVSVLDQEYALIEVDLKPSEAIIFPQPINEWNLSYKQQFSNFGRDFWLPVDVRIEGSLKIGFIGLQFPTIKYHQVSRLTDYQVNIPLPDSLFDRKRLLSVDSLTIKQNPDSLFSRNPEVIPLSQVENEAYSELDSTMTMEKAFRPTGPLARFINFDDDGGAGGRGGGKGFQLNISPRFRYNRVDGAHLGLGIEPSISSQMKIGLSAAYKTNPEEWGAKVFVGADLNKRGNIFARLTYRSDTESRYQSENFSREFASFRPMFGQEDYFDHYWVDGFTGLIGRRTRWPIIETILTFRIEDHTSRTKITRKDLFGRSNSQRPNPEINSGKFRSVSLRLSFGENYIPFGVVGQTRLSLDIEHAPGDFLDNDFSFTRYQVSFVGRVPTFLRRRIFPNSLDFRIVAGTYSGKLPLQRFGIVDGRLSAFGPFGTFRSLGGVPLEGEEYAAFYGEHNFRTVPFEILGLRGLAKRDLGIIVFCAAGRTWIHLNRLAQLGYLPSYQDSWRSEVGVSLNGILGLIRIDYARRLDQPSNHFSFGFKRWF